MCDNCKCDKPVVKSYVTTFSDVSVVPVLEVKIKKLSDQAVIPNYSNNGDACFDLVCTSYNPSENYIEYGTDLAFAIPFGYVGIIKPRSSVSKYNLIFSTSGVIDSGYRGQVTVRFKHVSANNYNQDNIFQIGDRIAQMYILPYPQVQFQEVEELDITERGTGGHGSSGN